MERHTAVFHLMPPWMFPYSSSSLFRREAGIAHSHAYRNN